MTSISAAGTWQGDIVWGILMLICGFLAIALPLASGDRRRHRRPPCDRRQPPLTKLDVRDYHVYNFA